MLAMTAKEAAAAEDAARAEAAAESGGVNVRRSTRAVKNRVIMVRAPASAVSLRRKAREGQARPARHTVRLTARSCAQIDGEPVLKANNYDLECGEQSIFDVELKRAAQGAAWPGWTESPAASGAWRMQPRAEGHVDKPRCAWHSFQSARQC